MSYSHCDRYDLMHLLLTFHFSGHDLTDKWVPVIQIPAFDKIVTRFFVGVLASVRVKNCEKSVFIGSNISYPVLRRFDR